MSPGHVVCLPPGSNQRPYGDTGVRTSAHSVTVDVAGKEGAGQRASMPAAHR